MNIEIPALRLSRLLTVFFLLVLVFISLQDIQHFVALSPLPVVIGQESEDAYLDRTLGWYAPTMRSIGQLTGDGKVLMLWEARGLYAPPNVQADPWIDNFRVNYWKFRTPEKIKNEWISHGFTYLLYYRNGAQDIRSGHDPMDPQGWRTLDALISSLPAPISFGDVYFLYALK